MGLRRLIAHFSNKYYNRIQTIIKSELHEGRSLVLGIESSCDDSCAAIVREDGKVLSSIQSSQGLLNQHFRGIIPHVAARSHHLNLPLVMERAISGFDVNQIDAVALTIGPGISPCLGEGLMNAKSFCKQFNKPLILVNHMEGHAMISTMTNTVSFPLISFLVSGGNTEIILCNDVYSAFVKIGDTKDDACGECMDKVYRRICEITGEAEETIVYDASADIDSIIPTSGDSSGATSQKKHGGAQISVYSAEYEQLNTLAFGDRRKWEKENRILFPTPMAHSRSCDYSFSGIKTFSLRYLDGMYKRNEVDHQSIIRFCYYFENALIKHLLKKLEMVLQMHSEVKSLCGGGGVMSNKRLRSELLQLCEKYQIAPYLPDPSLCTDNAVMIAWRGIQLWKKGLQVISVQDVDSVRYDEKLDFKSV